MKKALVPVLAIIAVAAIVLCFVLNGQKGDLEKKASELETKIEELKAEAAKAAEEAAKAAEEAAKAAEETAKAAEEAIETAAETVETTEETAETAEETAKAAEEAAETAEETADKVMSYEEYMKADLDATVCVETYVQATQSWWDGKITVYAQSQDGAIFIYNMACAEEDAAKLVAGTKIRVKGFKAEWAGEVEITEATFEFVDGDSFVAEAEDVTAFLGKDELINHMNEKVSFKGLKVAPSKVEGKDEEYAFLYAWDGSGSNESNSDLYFNVELDGQVYTFTVESYLCGNTTDVYKAVEALKIGEVIDLEGFLYWYNGANPHITAVTAAK